MIASVVRILSFLLPIPFMALFYIKSKKFEFLKNYVFLAFLVPVFVQLLSVDIGYHFDLVVAYMTFTLFGASIFNRKGWSYLQALSLSFCLVYFGSFLWELPYHVYTIIIRGGIDGAFPLHLIYVFPMIFVYEKVKTNLSRNEILVILSDVLLLSTLGMGILVTWNLDIWNTYNNTIFESTVEELIWMMTRLVTMFGLFAIYVKSTLRKTKEK